MADEGLPALQLLPTAQVPVQPAPAVQLPVEPAQHDLLVPQVQPVHLAPLNWSHFKPEFAGKPEDDAEAHFLHTNDWMDTHNIPDDVKVQRFCLT